MILKFVESVSSKDIFYVAKIVVDLSIFSQLSFFNNYFLKLLQKLKKKPAKFLSFFRCKLIGKKIREKIEGVLKHKLFENIND